MPQTADDTMDDDDVEELRGMFASLSQEKTAGTDWLERLREVHAAGDPTTGSVSGRIRARREAQDLRAAGADASAAALPPVSPQARAFGLHGSGLNPFLLRLRGSLLVKQNVVSPHDGEPRPKAA